MPLRLLIRIACSIPILFSPVIFDGHYLVDGGLLDNIPIHVFDGTSPSDNRAKLNMSSIDPHTLAIMLLGDLKTDGDRFEQGDVGLGSGSHKISNKIDGVFSYYGSILNALVDNGVQRYQRPSYWLRTIPVHVPAYPLTHFKLSRVQVQDMFVYGYEATKDFFT